MSIEARKYDAVNLAQGMPDFPAPQVLKDAACRAIQDDVNQYAITWGAHDLRHAIAEHAAWHLGLKVDPETEITVTCGSTEAMLVALLSLINPGDEVILSQPFYENYWPDCVLAGATPRFVPVRPPHWTFDPDELAAAFNDRTKAIVLCNPNNPTGDRLHPRRARTDRRPLPQVGRGRDHRRDLRAHPLRRPQARRPGEPRRHARAVGDDRRDVEDLRRDRLADRHDPRPLRR